MKIAFTGGGTGGHFYPILAVAEEIQKIKEQEGLNDLSLYFLSNTPYDQKLLDSHSIQFIKIPAGKVRTYFSPRNILDFFVTSIGILVAIIRLLIIYPDVIFGKGGYASFPTLFAARLLAIPVVIHDSDTVPGRVNKWAGKFARRVAISWEEAAEFFPEAKTAVTGQPVREALRTPIKEGSFEHFSFQPGPVLCVLGGSQGAQRINDFILDMLPTLVEQFQVIHQTGEKNFKDMEARARIIFEKAKGKERYKAVPTLDEEGMRRMAGITTLIVSRSGSGILEFAHWGIPSILIPIPEEISRDQRTNAYSLARRKGAAVIEEKNLTEAVFLSELKRITDNQGGYVAMRDALKSLAHPEAGKQIAEELIRITRSHK
ncbi:hypothetical protein CL654_02550 [bacterium]|nr:hypothetical protein [bacterium]|tara:strand:+ start:6425 stop:7546 length:1122 start_codon:yes stop_codon:yes gene_type:complete